jgi:Tfp pilus assembly protein PilZ
VEVQIEAPGYRVAATATTLGAGGLFVATQVPLRRHTPLVVRFCLPGEDSELCLDAHVAWSKEPGSDGALGMGLSFDDPDARAALAGLLERWAERRDAVSGTDGV